MIGTLSSSASTRHRARIGASPQLSSAVAACKPWSILPKGESKSSLFYPTETLGAVPVRPQSVHALKSEASICLSGLRSCLEVVSGKPAAAVG